MRRSTDRAVLFLVLGFAIVSVFAGAYVISRTTLGVSTLRLRDAQVDACDRGNVLRRESNRRVDAFVVDARNLLALARGAEVARMAAYRQSHNPFDLKAARLYARIVASQETLRFRRVALIDCEAVVPQP
jgi:hypothetical protein